MSNPIFKRLSRRMARWWGGKAPAGTPLWLDELEQLASSGRIAPPDYRFTFIVGASGSGTTLLSRVLSSPAGTVCLGGMYWTVSQEHRQAWLLMKAFNQAITWLWDRHGTVENYHRARRLLPVIVQQFLSQPEYSDRKQIIYKRSAPFNYGDRFRPDISDLFTLFPKVRIVVIHRDPAASTYSSLRRKFAENLHQSAVITEEQLTYLSAQLATFPAGSFYILNYEAFCRQPLTEIEPLAAFCDLPLADLQQAIQREDIKSTENEKWRRELDPAGVEFLESFFDTRRRQQWPLLNSRES